MLGHENEAPLLILYFFRYVLEKDATNRKRRFNYSEVTPHEAPLPVFHFFFSTLPETKLAKLEAALAAGPPLTRPKAAPLIHSNSGVILDNITPKMENKGPKEGK